MALIYALMLLVAIIVLVVLTERWRMIPFLALLVITCGYGFAMGADYGWFGHSFGLGFAQTLATSGLMVVAGLMLSALAEGSGVSARLFVLLTPLVNRLGAWFLLGPLALLGGLASSPSAAFAVLTPLRRIISGQLKHSGMAGGLMLALGLSLCHGVVLPSPVPVAATAILGAEWSSVLMFGLPVALVGLILGRLIANHNISAYPYLPPDQQQPTPSPTRQIDRGIVALILISLLLISLMIIQSVGEMPSEPWGGGPKRAMMVGAARPLMMVVGSVGLMVMALGRWDREVLAEQGWLAKALDGVSRLILTMAAAGGFQMVLQTTGMAELLSEKTLDWQIGLAVPFVAALINKVLQGSSVTAAITTAGMIQPFLVQMGLDTESGRALAVIALGLGSMAGTHINDDYFWLVTGNLGLRPWQGIKLLSLGSVLQSLGGMATLLLIAQAAEYLL